MSLPTLTPEQRAQALEKAAQARQLRAKLKEDIAAGKVTLPALMDDEFGPYADTPEIVNKTKVVQLLQAVKGIGTVKAETLMAQCNIAENRRLGGLGRDQRRRLTQALAEVTG
ncbi:integration host factor [Dietzia cinnamea]|uniref:integration host factor, actinobacterial type n=1 Tax=Dietzia TaxID=37914 RepID=UPI000D09713E|nr:MULTISPECIES: integration host factor, actinobacterial type [Dietzia]AVM66187.1 integration host factor [Dietzia sp. oral taxon 368]MCT1886751.1 integration host factor [Dietzia cinnamea]MCT2302617.1 integration host factor [Dietzia cinnamea]